MSIQAELGILSKSLSDFSTRADRATEEAVKQALSDNDVQSVFFVNQISKDQSGQTLSNLNASNYYTFPRVERTLYDKVKEGALPSDTSLESSFTRSAYRVRLFDYLLQTIPWLALDAQSTRSPIALPIISHHADKVLYQEQIHQALTSFTYSGHVAARLEMTAKSIAEIITLTQKNDPSEKRFWVLITYMRNTGATLRPILRSYQFVFNTNKEQSSVSFSYNLYATIFNEAEFEAARKSIDPRLIELGVRLTEQKSSDIYLPSVSTQDLSVE